MSLSTVMLVLTLYAALAVLSLILVLAASYWMDYRHRQRMDELNERTVPLEHVREYVLSLLDIDKQIISDPEEGIDR